MKKTKRLFLLALALVLVAGLLPAVALNAHAAAHSPSEPCVFGDWVSKGNGTHTRTCECGERQTSRCTGGTATCTVGSICRLCGSEYTAPNGHALYVKDYDERSLNVWCSACSYRCYISIYVEGSCGYTGSEITPVRFYYEQPWEGPEPEITYSNNINASETPHTVTIRYPGLDYTLVKEFYILPVSLNRCDLSISPERSLYTSEKLPEPTITVTFNGKPLVRDVDYTIDWSDTSFTNVNDYTATVTGIGNFCYSREIGFRIASISIPGIRFTQKNTLTYTGEPQTPVVEPNITEHLGNAATYTFAATSDGPFTETVPSVTEGGLHYLYYRVEADNHGPHKGTFTVWVDQADNEWTTAPAIEGWTYGDTPNAPTGKAKFGDYTVTYTGKTKAGETYESKDAPTEAGVYKAIFTVAETDSYAGLTAEVDFTVQRKTMTREDVTYTEPTDLVYNGKGRRTDLSVTIAGEEREWALNFYNADTDELQDPQDAGDYYFTLTAVEDSNHLLCLNLEAPDFKFTIHKADPTISWDTTAFTYDGAEHGAAKVTLVNGETYTGEIDYTCTKGSDTSGNLPVDAGTYKLTASIDGQKNYNAASEETTIIINPMTITPAVTIDRDVVVYDGSDHRPTVAVSSNGAAMHKSDYAVSRTDTVKPGVATVTVKPVRDSNYTFENVSVYFLIMPDVSDLKGVTPENVTSAYQGIIDDIQAQMDGKDVSKAGGDGQKQWNDLIERLKKLEDAIKQIREKMQQIIDETAALPAHPAGDDLDKIDDLLDLYDEIKDQLTGAEKEALADEIEKLETEKAHILDTKQAAEDTLADAQTLLDKDMTHKDEEAVDAMIARISDLLTDPHLAREQKEALEDALDALNDVKDAFEAAAAIEEMIDELPKTGEPDDKDLRKAYRKAKDAYEDLGEDKGKVDPKYVTKLEKLAKALRNYKIITGNAQRWYTDAEEVVNLYFTANGPYSKFDYIKIDGELLDEKHYTSKEGSTIVGLKASYLQTLGYAKHTIAIGYVDGELSGEATGYFRVTLHVDSPATGDTTNIIALGAVCLVSLAALVGLMVYRKKRGGKAE